VAEAERFRGTATHGRAIGRIEIGRIRPNMVLAGHLTAFTRALLAHRRDQARDTIRVEMLYATSERPRSAEPEPAHGAAG
jgi:hypothetical protein